MVRNDFFHGFREEHLFFDEGPRTDPSFRTAINTSSIVIDGIDPFRHGVELTQQKHFDAGLAKIHAGEPGHVMHHNHWGEEDRNFRNEDNFTEIDNFNPVVFLRAQDDIVRYADLLERITFPIITGDSNQRENFIMDGIIEPFTIRARAAFFSIEAPFESHEAKGALMAGNTDPVNSSEQVLTVTTFDLARSQIPFLDLVDRFSSNDNISLAGRFFVERITIGPFIDAKNPRNALLSLTYFDETMDAAMSLMSGSTENYIKQESRSATSGWDYDNNVWIGTDSVAFGGMTY